MLANVGRGVGVVAFAVGISDAATSGPIGTAVSFAPVGAIDTGAAVYE